MNSLTPSFKNYKQISFEAIKSMKFKVKPPINPRKSKSSPRFSNHITKDFEENESIIRISAVVPYEDRDPNSVINNYLPYLTSYELQEIRGYKEIFYLGKTCQKIRTNEVFTHNLGLDDKDENLIVKINDHIAYRYKITAIIGHTYESITCLCYDYANGGNVAIEIFANTEEMRKQRQIEITAFQRMKKTASTSHIINCLDHFVFRGHFCFVFEVLGSNVDSIIKSNPDSNTIDFAKIVALSLFEGIRECHSNNVTHGKINIRNILVDPLKRGSFKLSDFNNCSLDEESRNAPKRFIERSPDEILNRNCSKKAFDIWCAGLALCYIILGKPLIRGRNPKEMIESIISISGFPPDDFSSKNCGNFELIEQYYGYEGDEEKKYQHFKIEKKDLQQLFQSPDLSDLVLKCLKWKGEERITPEEALSHPFIQQSKLPPLKKPE